jgi:hypothetical protein
VEQPKENSYEAPQIVDYGDLVELTAAASHGSFTDATFPAHTPSADLTFTNTP